jgi:hypothetical protein
MEDHRPMEDALLFVLVVVPLIAFAVAVVALATSGGSYDRIGRGGLSLEEPPPAAPAGDREADLRDLLEARNARRVARGEAPADVDAELRALRAPADPGLEEEVRQLVAARNARRAARGQPPLDVEAEVSRRLREL